MIAYVGKKVALLSCLVSGVIVGAQHYSKDNCVPVPINEATLYGDVHTVFLLDKKNRKEILLQTDSFNRPVKSANWDNQRQGILHIGFEDGNKLEIDVNKPLKVQ